MITPAPSWAAYRTASAISAVLPEPFPFSARTAISRASGATPAAPSALPATAAAIPATCVPWKWKSSGSASSSTKS